MPRRARHKTLSLPKGFVISLAVIFLVNSIGGGVFTGESWAAKISSGLTSVGSEREGSPAPLKSLNADTFTLPQELGYIQESTQLPNSTKTVIHIQDAHCNYAAQKSISGILNYLTTEYGIYAVNCEGGKDDYDLSVFTDIPEQDIREKTSDFFVREGVVNAAEYFAVNNPSKAKLWGIEDTDLYIKNLKIYRDSLAHKNEVDRNIKSISYIIDNLKRHIYSNELLEFDTYYSNYKENKVSFKEYVAYLIMIAEKRLIGIKSFSDIYLLSQTLEQEDRIDFKKANNEKDEVVDRLKKVLSRNELGELMTKVGELKIERISQAEFYAYLAKKAKSIKLDLGGYPELQKYIIYVSLYGAIDKTKVAKEISMLEDRIRESLCENDTQRELGILSKNLVLTKNIFNISLTIDDYTYYIKHQETFAVVNYINFIDKFAPLYKITARLNDGITRLDVYREKVNGFYQCSLERDKAFIKNIKFTDHDRPNSIIITGGFHTESLRELFKKENVSYISIMPKFKNEKGYESPYLKRLAGQRTALENVIDTAIPAVLNLAVVNILSELGIIVEGRNNIEKFHLAVAIMATIKRGESFVLKISEECAPEGEEWDGDKLAVFTNGGGDSIRGFEAKPDSEFAKAVNAVVTKIAPEFKYDMLARVEGAPVLPAAAVPFTGREEVVEPTNTPESKGSLVIGTLKGKTITNTAGWKFVVSTDGRKVAIMPPGELSVIVRTTGKTVKDRDKDRAIRKIRTAAKALKGEERERFDVFLGRLPGVTNIKTIRSTEEISALLLDNTLYLRKDLLSRPGIIFNEKEVTIRTGEPIYEKARKIVPEIVSMLRRDSRTYLISPVASIGDISGTENINRTAEQFFGKQNQHVRAKGYLAGDKWVEGLRDRLASTLPEFCKDALEARTTRLAIRIIVDDARRDARTLIDKSIEDYLKMYTADQQKIILSKIKFIPVRIVDVKHLNPAIDLFADLGMMECDRYKEKDYGDEGVVPRDLNNRLLALLKLSATNIEELIAKEGEDILKIMNAIFNGYSLIIRPVNWESVSNWKKNQDAVLKSL